MKKRQIDIKVNIQACSGCRLCEISCSLSHEKVVNLAKSRVRVSDDYDHSLFIPHICQLCPNPPCVITCPTGALSQNPDTGVIWVNQEACTGCGRCAEDCPYGAIWYNKEFKQLFVCDRCEGQPGQPQCIQFCYANALQLVSAVGEAAILA